MSSNLVGNEDYITSDKLPMKIYGVFRVGVKQRQSSKNLIIRNVSFLHF